MLDQIMAKNPNFIYERSEIKIDWNSNNQQNNSFNNQDERISQNYI